MNSPAPIHCPSRQTLMYTETAEAAAVLERQRDANDAAIRELTKELRARPPRFVTTCARGSSSHACTFAKYAIETRLGLAVATATPSVGSLYAVTPALEDTLYLVASQSGKSPDLIRNAERAKAGGARVVALVNVEDSPLAAVADHVLPLHAGPERSVAATKSCLATLAAIVHLTARWAEDEALLETLDQLPDRMREAFQLDWSALVDGLLDAHNLFVIGRGYGLCAAQEMALKFKETCGLHAEAFSSAEVRHGPMALMDAGFPALVIGQQDATLDSTLAVANDFRQHDAAVWTAIPGDHGTGALPVVPAADPLLSPLLSLQTFYRAVNALALARGCDPDAPPHLNKVTKTR